MTVTSRPARAATRRHLGADEARADDRHPSGEGEVVPEGDAVVEGPQDVHAGHGLDPRDPARMGTRGDDEAVVGQDLTILQGQPMP